MSFIIRINILFILLLYQIFNYMLIIHYNRFYDQISKISLFKSNSKIKRITPILVITSKAICNYNSKIHHKNDQIIN